MDSTCGAFLLLYKAMRELEVAWSGFIVVELGRNDVEVDAEGRATPKTEPGVESFKAPGVLAVSYCLVGGAGSYDEADESVIAYWVR